MELDYEYSQSQSSRLHYFYDGKVHIEPPRMFPEKDLQTEIDELETMNQELVTNTKNLYIKSTENIEK